MLFLVLSISRRVEISFHPVVQDKLRKNRFRIYHEPPDFIGHEVSLLVIVYDITCTGMKVC